LTLHEFALTFRTAEAEIFVMQLNWQLTNKKNNTTCQGNIAAIYCLWIFGFLATMCTLAYLTSKWLLFYSTSYEYINNKPMSFFRGFNTTIK
jgi:hypothetical protein